MRAEFRTYFVCVWVGLAATLSPLPGETPSSDYSAAEVAVTPGRVVLPPGEERCQVSYRFSNASSQSFAVTERSAFFHSLTNTWQSGTIGPIPTHLVVPGLANVEWKDRPEVPADTIRSAVAAEGVPTSELVLVQNFTIMSAAGEKSSLSASIIFRVDQGVAATERTDLAHYELTVLRSLQSDPLKNEQLKKLCAFADASYEKLSEVLGFVPKASRKVPLRIVEDGGYPYYSGQQNGYVNIPASVLESDWLSVAYPHELTHYFLLEEFPSPPRWFVEGPASFFGNKVSEALGYEKEAASDRRKIMDWAEEYRRRSQTYLFGSAWPKDGPNGNLTEFGSFGMGAAYEVCTKLEALCGPQFFPNLFRYLRKHAVSFAGARTEQERNWILIGAMQVQTGEDLWKFFAENGCPL